VQTRASSARKLVRDAAEKLARASVPEPRASAEVLLAELLGIRRGELSVREEPLTDEEAIGYWAWISRRLKREPVQHILGYSYFRNLWLELDEHTLVPRPETESVVDIVLKVLNSRDRSCRVLELGTGSGAIAISIVQERPYCDVCATDNSEGALRVARRNAARVGTKVRFYKVDLASGLSPLLGSIEVLVSNPPYVRSVDIPKLVPEVRGWDPHAALDGGPDGLGFYRRIFEEVPPLLAKGADVVLEVGDGQAEAVLELGRRAGYEPLGAYADLTGRPRTVRLYWSS
jgi:release factor glutamine methyltransferase